MHAYLIVGKNEKTLEKESKKIVRKFKADLLEFSVSKIDEVRELSRFIKLSFNKPTVFLIKEVDKASIAALNAFLKILEEPQENAKFILTARSEHNILPTIVSRCQVIKESYSRLPIASKNAKKFLKIPLGEKFAHIDKIRKREDAISFIENLILYLHQILITTNKYDKLKLAKALRVVQKTHASLKANGNVGLQLTNLLVNL
jgi:DNA polymerase III delta prime subunit